MDIADEAALIVDAEIKSVLDRHKHRGKVVPTGRCRYCQGAVEEGELFCDIDCASDYERAQFMKAQHTP